MTYTFWVRFEWDPQKERQNVAKHGVTFKEAKALFTSKVDFLEIYDAEHSDAEERFIAIGPIRRGLCPGRLHGAARGHGPHHQRPWASKTERALYVEYMEKDA